MLDFTIFPSFSRRFPCRRQLWRVAFHVWLQVELAFETRVVAWVRIVTKWGKLLKITKQQDLLTLRFTRRLYNRPFVWLWIDFILRGSDTDGKHTTHQKLEVFSCTKLIRNDLNEIERSSDGLLVLHNDLKDFHFEGAILIRKNVFRATNFVAATLTDKKRTLIQKRHEIY